MAPAHRNCPGFLYHPDAAFYRPYNIPFLSGPVETGERKVRIDPIAERVVIEFTRDGVDLVYPMVMPLDVYIDRLIRSSNHSIFLENNRKLKQSSGTGGSSKHFNIDIPVRFPKTLGRILGQGANIQVSGSESITFSGETMYYYNNERQNESGGQRKFPELDMRQQLQINLTGTIGEKLTVEVAHNSESQVPLENRIKLRYQGFEDEVIQKIEVGNTDLTLPGNQFVSFSSKQQGLFGVKLVGKAGNLDFTTIMSQQQGKTDQASYTGTSKDEERILSDLDYVKNRYFVLNNFEPIGDLRVFVDDDNANNNDGSQMKGTAFMDADTTSANFIDGWFDELEESSDYYINRDVGILTLNRSLADNYTMAVYFLDTTYTVETGHIPDAATVDTNIAISLKIIRPPILYYKPSDERFGDTWYYQMRNIYDIGARNIQKEGLELKIYRKEPGAEERFDQQSGVPFSQIMGLDLENNDDFTRNPDYRVDIEYRGVGEKITGVDKAGIPPGQYLPYLPTYLVDGEMGLLIFPDLRPFDPAYNHQFSGESVLTLDEPNPAVYDNHDPKTTDSKYEIEVKYRTSQTSFSLNRSNILEGSEVVKLNGRTLTRGTDYRIIYEIGQIDFLTDEAEDPEAEITIDFEYAPFLAQAQKTLAGTAGTYKFSDQTKLSSIFLFKSKKTPHRRPRLGQEPSQILVSGLSLSTEQRPGFLTRLADKIPGIRAREESRFHLSLEAAATMPNPNTKNSVYLDDMEGTEESSSFGLVRRQWDFMSIPETKTGGKELVASERFQDVWWYNPRNTVTRGDINPDLTEEERKKFVSIMEVALRNGSTTDENSMNAWGGIMRIVSKTGLDLKERKFFEVWVNDYNRNRGKMHIDMGLLSEDAMWSWDEPNGQLDSEDKVPRDGKLDDSGSEGPNDEDSGLDGMFNYEETGGGSDPHGDDWSYNEDNKEDYSRINGMEGNGFLDTEDLNGNGKVDDEKAYFRFTVDFESREYLAANGTQDANTNWSLYRIPMAKAVEETLSTDPTFDKGVKYVRIWFEDLGTTDATFQIYSMEVTGNRWLEAGVQDSSGMLLEKDVVDAMGTIFAAGVINNKEGEDYDPPPVEIRVERQVPEKEQSLVLNYESLQPGHTGTVFRPLFEDEDYTRYENLEFWIKRATPGVDPVLYPDPVFFFRFGGDSLNFYEVEKTLDYEGWSRVELDLAEMTRIKTQDTSDSISLYGVMKEMKFTQLGDLTLRVVGNPSMTKVGRLAYGVTNRSSTMEMTGTIWVDDLRLINDKGDAGMAARIGIDLDVSDLLSVNVDYRKVGKEFRRVTGGGGTGNTVEENPRAGSDNTDLSIGGSVRLGKFMEGIGVSMPLNVSWSKNLSLPELQNASDIVLDDPSTQKTEKKSSSASISIQRNKKSKNPWLYYSIDAMRFRVNGKKSSSFNPTKVDSTWSYALDWSYGYSPRFNSDLKVFRSWRINPLPTSLNISAHKDRSESNNYDVRGDTRRIVGGNASTSSLNFAMSPIKGESFTSDFNFSTSRDHTFGKPLPFYASANIGMETGRNHSAKMSYNPRFGSILSWFQPRISYSTKYTETTPIGQRVIQVDEASGDTLSQITMHNVQNNNTSSIDFGISPTKIFSIIPDRENSQPDDSTASRVRPMAILEGIKSVGSRVGDINTAITLGRDSRYDKLKSRPDIKYQFGITNDVDEKTQYRQNNQTVTSNKGQDIGVRASSNVNLIPDMSLRISFNQSARKSTQARSSKESKSRTWPDLTYSWDGLEGIWKLDRYLKAASFEMAYTRKTDQSGKSLDRLESENTSVNWDPLVRIDLEIRGGIRGGLSADKSVSTNKNLLGAGSEKVVTNKGMSANFNYKFTSRKKINVPILGKGTKGGSFTATTTFGLNFRYSTSKDEQIKPYRINNHTRDFSISPKMTWTWLQNLSGGLELRYGERRNLKNENKSTRSIGASISALFKF